MVLETAFDDVIGIHCVNFGVAPPSSLACLLKGACEPNLNKLCVRDYMSKPRTVPADCGTAAFDVDVEGSSAGADLVV